MMPPKHHGLPRTFPHKMVFAISFVLCLCACASVVNAVLAWNSLLWGFYFGTGFWSGAVILLAGMFGIVASFVRNICSVKTFMIISIFGCIASLGMIALAAGGLDSDSGFYDGNNRGVLMTHVVHAVYLGLGLLQLTLCVLSDGICVYYLFIEKNAEIYHMNNSKTRNSDSSLNRESKYRSSSGSEIPLVGRNSSKRKQTQNSGNDKSGSNNNIENDGDDEPVRFNTVKPLHRNALQRQENVTSPIRNMRSASFSTFGRFGGHERTALIDRSADDVASAHDTSGSFTGSYHFDENAYAQIPLFGPPLPIEDDDELPPYQVSDGKLLKRKRGLKRPKSEEVHMRSHPPHRSHTTPNRGKRKLERIARNAQNQLQIQQERANNSCENILNKQQRLSFVEDKSNSRRRMRSLSRSADLLSTEEDSPHRPLHDGNHKVKHQHQGDFARSSDMILEMDDQVELRHRHSNQTQSLRVNREKRLDRRRKALSAEVKLNRDLVHDRLISNEQLDFQHNYLDGSNPNLYAGNRIRPTKFSLRRPMRQSGNSYVNAPVPVRPIVSIPSVKAKPPPKPPRTHSVSADDLNKEEKEINYEIEVENLFADINELNDVDDVFSNEPFKVSTNVEPKTETKAVKKDPRYVTNSDPKVRYMPGSSINSNTYTKKKSSVLNGDISKTVGKSNAPVDDNLKTIESKPIAYVSSTKSVPLSPEANLDSGPVITLQPKSPDVKLDSGPMLKFVPPKQITRYPQVMDDPAPRKISNSTNDNDFNKRNGSITLPTSPVLKQPPIRQNSLTSYRINDAPEKAQQNGTVANLGETKVIKLHETPKTVDKLRNVPNANNVVYAQVRHSKTDSETSVSPTSPTSPTSRMLKARRLLYSFTDKDVNVFDPVSTGTESEEVFEVTDTQKINYPVTSSNYNTPRKDSSNRSSNKSNNSAISNIVVRSPPTSPLELIQGDKQRENVKISVAPEKDNKPRFSVPETSYNNNSAISNITMRSSPLSASERILQRRGVKSENLNNTSDTKDRPVILQPVMSSPSRHSYGARPKTKYPGSLAPLPPPKPANKPIAIQPYDRNADIGYNSRVTKTITLPKTTNQTAPNPSPLPQPSQIRNNLQTEASTQHLPRGLPPSSQSSTASSVLPAPSITRNSLSSTLMPSPQATLSNVKCDPVVVNTVHLPTPSPSFAIPRDVPVNRVQATPTVSIGSSNAQGIAQMPQAQYSRNISVESPQPVFANQQQGAARPRVVNDEQDTDNNTETVPLFSVVL